MRRYLHGELLESGVQKNFFHLVCGELSSAHRRLKAFENFGFSQETDEDLK
jgi:hypothetical protein